MGRDVKAHAEFANQSGHVHALLENDVLILRGEVRARIPRTDVKAWKADGPALHLHTGQGELVLNMSGDRAASEADRWVKALDRAPPTLADKLGLAGARLWLLTPIDDAALVDATKNTQIGTAQDATLGLAILHTAADLEQLLQACADHPALPVWAVNEKGKGAALAEHVIRDALRAAGLVDVKACAVSATLSATRYQRRKG